MKVIEVKGLTKLYENKRGINNLNFTLDAGKILCIIGNNGAGKTTALKCIMNLLIPDQGEILINGNSIFMDSKKYKKNISYIPEVPIYYNELTVYDHLKFIAMAYEMDYKEFDKKVKFYASKYEVENYLHCYFNELSKGTKQKMFLIMTLIKRSSLLILDEPFDGLDVFTVDKLINCLKELRNDSVSVIITSHNMDIVSEVSDYLLILKDSNQIVYDSVNDLYAKYKTNDLGYIFKNIMLKDTSEYV